jgi:hypothetical protein
MRVNIMIKYLGKSVKMSVDFDDELLSDETYKIGREANMDTIINHFYDNMELEVEVPR